MTDVSAPLPPQVPPTVGPFTVLGLLRSEGEGQLVRARDVRARQVELVLLSGAAGDDPAARDRFIGAAEAAYRDDPNAVLGASPAGAHAWVALSPGSGERLMPGLLGATEPRAGAGHRGPDFDPYWRGRGGRPWWQEGLAYWGDERVAKPWWRYWWAVLIAVILLLLLLLLLSQCQPTPVDGSPTGTPTESVSPTESGSPTPDDTGSPTGPTSPTTPGQQTGPLGPAGPPAAPSVPV